MSTDFQSLYLAALRQLPTADNHVCLPYEDRSEQIAAFVPFFRVGFERNEKCLYIASENSIGAIVEALRSAGIDTGAKIRYGQLALATEQTTFTKYGDPQPGWMIGYIKQSIERALADGCDGLRIVCEMNWTLKARLPVDALLEYEDKLNCFLQGLPRAVMCQYSQRQFPPDLIAQVIEKHPLVVHGGTLCRNPDFVPPEELLHPKPGALDVDRLLNNVLSHGHKPRGSVLVVDDQFEVRFYVKSVLERAGLKVFEAKDGLEALRVLDNAKPDLLLADVKMPGMDGIALLDEVARRSPDLPVLMMSGLVDDSARTGKAKGFIQKPFLPKVLLKTVIQSLQCC